MKTTLGVLTTTAALALFACSSDVTTVTTDDEPREIGASAPGAARRDTTSDVAAAALPGPRLAVGLAVKEIAVFQGVKVTVARDGQAVAANARNAPLVASRPGLVRVYVAPTTGYVPQQITAELTFRSGGNVVDVQSETKVISAASTDEAVASTFNFLIPASSLPAGVSYDVALTSKTGVETTGPSDARFPKGGGAQDLQVERSGTLKVVIVPVRYDADGSGRMPDLSEAQLTRYHETLTSLYPASNVELSVRAPLPWTSVISKSGTGFSSVLTAIRNLRRNDGVPSDVYYYGIFSPSSSFSSYCSGGCVTGLSALVTSPQTSVLRASIGVGFAGDVAIETAAHEIGHAHGRAHAPCGGPAGVDPDYPYANATLGTWGYDILSTQLVRPSLGRDLMAYCPNAWVSDYTFSALFDRIAVVNGNPRTVAVGKTVAPGTAPSAPSATPSTPTGGAMFRIAAVEADGSIGGYDDVELDDEPTGGDPRLVTYASATGAVVGTRTARFYPYDHLPGGVLLVPETPSLAGSVATWSTARVAGLRDVIAR